MAENYIRCGFQNALKAHFPEHVHIIKGVCYASASLLSAISTNGTDHWRCINNSEIKGLRTIDISDTAWDISILERQNNAWCTFAINARRAILKDFSMHPNCFCSNISSPTRSELNRINIVGTQVTHLITVFDIDNTIISMKRNLSELDSIEILNRITE
jgi:hypothetical protein